MSVPKLRAMAAAMVLVCPAVAAYAASPAPAPANQPDSVPPPNAPVAPEVEAAMTTQVAQSATPPAQPTDVSTPDTQAQKVDVVTVTAQRLKQARIDMVPKFGTTVYTIDESLISALGQGDATPFDEVLLHLPGVDKDSKASGSLHVRDDHANVQYRINGVLLPENISGFGTSIDSRYVSKIDFVTGTVPAQYGLRTAGVVEIQTKDGDVPPGGQIELLVGSNNAFQPSAQLFGTKGPFSYYLSGSYVSNSQGIEIPTPVRSNPHDKTVQEKSFGDFSYYVNEDTRLGFLFGTYNGRFQIPVNPNIAPGFNLAGVSDLATQTVTLPSSQLNENQTEVNRFFIGVLQRTAGNLDFQASIFHQYSNLHYTPDPVGDLVYLGVASDTLRSNSANGVQVDASYKLNPAHTLRFGGGYTAQTTQSNNTVGVFQADSSGNQLPSTIPGYNIPFYINDDSSKLGQIWSLYLQDEWHIDARFTVNYGARFDHVNAFIDEQQISPRLNMAYALTDATSVHAGYSRTFTPPPQELASQKSVSLYADSTNQAAVTTDDNVKAERAHYFDVGIVNKVTSNLTASVDTYYRSIRDLIDEGQFGQALILSPFNYDKGYAKGIELSAIYTDKQWTGYLNLAYQKAQGENIVSGQALFGPDELAYIANHYIYLDHDQTYTISGGASYTFGANRITGDAIFGTGLRRTAENVNPTDVIPNGDHLPAYMVVNATYIHTWDSTPVGKLQGRVGILNLFDKSYELRDGTGVGVGAPQWGVRRTFFTALALSF
jgi:outer membrane receptor protein involved in Fe transport